MKLPENWSDVVTSPSAGDADVQRHSGLPAIVSNSDQEVVTVVQA